MRRDEYLDQQRQRQEPTPSATVDNFPAVQPVSGPVTNTELRAVPVNVAGPLTNAELRAVAVPVSGPLTDAQLRAAAVPVSAAALPLPAGAATEAGITALYNLLAAVVHDIAVATRESVHELIHDGLVFSCCDVQTAVANNATVDYLFTAGNKELHLTWEIEGDTALTVEFFSGTTTSASGTALNIHNRKIGSANVPVAAISRGPTVTNAGTSRCMKRSGSAANLARTGGFDRASHEWDIPANTKGMLRITSLSGGGSSLNVSSDFVFYEV